MGIGLNVAGGTHHASIDSGAGFCIFNDVAVGANYLLQKHPKTQILIIDLDVHQGDGTATLFQNEPRVFTFSMHGKNNFPFQKPSSDLDIPLPDNTGNKVYLDTLKRNLYSLFSQVSPDYVFYIAGADVLEQDALGKLSLTIEGARQRDQIVISTAARHQTPIIVTMGGGYSPQTRDIVEAHCNTFRVAKKYYE
jgi:acetoin utilization deacetylase AcuC-like enzyme